MNNEILQIFKENPGIEERKLLLILTMKKFNLQDGVIPSNLTKDVEEFQKNVQRELADLVMGYQTVTCVDDKFYLKSEGLTIRELEIKEVLSKEKPLFQSIGMGLNNGILYFGTKFYKEGQFYDSIVTSDKKIYVDWKNSNEIKENFKLNYRFPLYHDVIDYMWSNTGKYGIRAWLFENLDNITIKEMYEDVLKLFKWKYWHPEEKIYKHHALSLISNYFLPIFEMKGREIIYGESGFGKTRLSRIYQLLTFNPVMSADWSDSSIYRTIESVSPTVIVDNFDSVEEEKRKRILHIFDVGAYKKGKSIRSEGKSFRPTGFNNFSNMILNSITNIKEVSENRSNITRTLKTEKPELTKLEDENYIWSEIRDKIHVCALQNYQEVQKIYEELKEEKIVSRELERVAPILTIAKIVDNNLYEEMVGFYIKENNRRKIKDLKEDWVYLAVEKIAEKLENENEVELRIKDVIDELAPEIFSTTDKNFDRKKHGLSVVIGSAFKNCILFPVRTLHGYPVYTFTKEKIIQFCKLKDFGNEIIEKISQKTLINSPNLTNSLNLPDSPNLPNTDTISDISERGNEGGMGESKGQVGTINNKKIDMM